jgi:hypothetical protein
LNEATCDEVKQGHTDDFGSETARAATMALGASLVQLEPILLWNNIFERAIHV